MSTYRRSVLRLLGSGVTVASGCTASESTLSEPTKSATTTNSRDTTTVDEQTRSTLSEPFSWSHEIGADIQFRIATRSGDLYVPSSDLHALSADGNQQWVFETPGELRSEPKVGDALYFVHSGVIQAVEFDGTERWQVPWERSGAPYILTTTEQRVYAGGVGDIGSKKGYELVAIDADTGETQWFAEIGARAEAVVHDSSIFVANPKIVRAFSTSDGSKLWESHYESTLAGLGGIADDTVVVYDDDVYAFSASDGTNKWVFGDDGDFDEHRDEDLGIVRATVRDGRVFVATERGFSIHSVTDGRTEWQTETFDGTPDIEALGEEVVLLSLSSTSSADTLAAVNLADREVAWTWSDGQPIQEAYWSGSEVLVRGDTTLRWIDSSGSERRRFDFEIPVNSPTITDSGVYLGTRVTGKQAENAPTVPGTVYGIEE